MIAYQFQQIEPVPARGKFKDSMLTDPKYVAEVKLDGHRAIAQFCCDKVRFTSRHVSRVTGQLVENTESLPHLQPAPLFMEGTVLDGELVTPLGAHGEVSDSMKVSSVMGSLPARAVSLQRENGWLHYHVFDCLFFRGRDVRSEPLRERRKLMETAVSDWKTYLDEATEAQGDLGGDRVHLIEHRLDDKEGFLDACARNGEEGAIFKNLEGKYHHLQWAKYKFQATYDVVVMGYEAAREESVKVSGELSRTKFAGMVGTIVFGQYSSYPGESKLHLCEVGKCSGFDDAMRAELTRDRDAGCKYVGRVFEIVAQSRLPSGKFRSPRFKRWRDDKEAIQCQWREDES